MVNTPEDELFREIQEAINITQRGTRRTTQWLPGEPINTDISAITQLMNAREVIYKKNESYDREKNQTTLEEHFKSMKELFPELFNQDGACNATAIQPNPNQGECKTMSIPYEELTQALPLKGMRVILNPDFIAKHERYSRLLGVSGTIINPYGSDYDIERQIKIFKKHGKSEHWNLQIKFDGKGTYDFEIRDLIPILNVESVIYDIQLQTGEYNTFTTKEEMCNYRNKYVIERGSQIRKENIWNNATRKELYDRL